MGSKSKKKRKKKRKKPPVLTSPWKIGTFVALMLLVTGSGVGYYFVRAYDIDLTWLGSDTSRWIVDSYEFFRETYPLAAGLVLMSLLTYFAIASAVRRYRFYLDSGQDYRRMISLAESIDDLTNPAQIARLSDYPELQDVLRSYGDQIREISAEINERQDENRSVDLEMEIDSILKGNPASESLIDGKWWAPVARKVETALRERPRRTDQDERPLTDGLRRAVSRSALACGRIMETAAGASEEISSIVDTAERLLASSAGAGRTAPPDTREATGAAEVLAGHLERLDRIRAAMAGFSERNNGLALNIALMAARGNVDEHQLAQYAESVRMTAEQFGALGRDLEAISRGVSDSCRAVAPRGTSGAGDGAAQAIEPMARDIDRRSRVLMERIASLVEDAEEIGSAVRSAGGQTEAADRKPQPTAPAGDRNELPIEPAPDGPDERMIVNFGTGPESTASAAPADDLVIDHGGSWSRPAEMPPREAVSPGTPGGEDGSLKISGLAESLAAQHAAAQTAPAREAQAEGSRAAPARDDAAPDAGGDWMEMPGHRWVKVDAPQDQVEPRAVRPAPADETGPSRDEMAAAEPETDGEPIYDLYDLGAVECPEETEATL